MSKSENSKQDDADILQSKADILRARDIIPPFDRAPGVGGDSEEGHVEEKPAPKVGQIPTTSKGNGGEGGFIPIEMLDDIKAVGEHVEKVTRGRPIRQLQEQGRIPKFDLAKEIMAEHRKTAAVKRRRPGKKKVAARRAGPTVAVGESDKSAKSRPTGRSISRLGQGKIIADIVARDIARFCRR